MFLNAAVVAAGIWRRDGEILEFTLLFCSQVLFPVSLPVDFFFFSKMKVGDRGRENLRDGGRVAKWAERLL